MIAIRWLCRGRGIFEGRWLTPAREGGTGPGGYVQWFEHDKEATTVIHGVGEEVRTEAFECFVDLVKKPFQGYEVGYATNDLDCD